ncbi:MAG: ABC transporter substrate-binding protein [candidate division Zixibacteria bacterium]|nr:ABC transporter substrate-binding protein [candidate division Zixibacteria bacterium]
MNPRGYGNSKILSILIALWIVLGFLTVPAVIVAAPSGDPVVLGAVISLTGRDAAFGQECLAGLNVAVDEANAEGGIQNRPIALQVYDDRSNPILAAEGVRTLVRDFSPIAIVGSNTSMVTAAAAVAAQNVGVPLVVPEATNPAISAIGDWIYRVCFLDPDMGNALATFAYHELGVRKVAVLLEEKHDYTASLAKYFHDRFTELGGEIVIQMSYPAGDTVFDDAIRVFKGKKADAIFVSGFYPEAGAIMAAARREKLDVAFLGGDGWESDQLFDIAGDAINDKSRAYIASHFSAEVQRVKVRGFVDTFQDRYGRRPNTSSALGFDAAGTILTAAEQATDLSPAAMKAALLGARQEGVTGHITIGPSRNPVKKVIILQARPGHRFAFVQSVLGTSPETSLESSKP